MANNTNCWVPSDAERTFSARVALHAARRDQQIEFRNVKGESCIHQENET